MAPAWLLDTRGTARTSQPFVPFVVPNKPLWEESLDGAGWLGERGNGDRAELASGTQVLNSLCSKIQDTKSPSHKMAPGRPWEGGSQKLLGLVARGGDKLKTVRRAVIGQVPRHTYYKGQP